MNTKDNIKVSISKNSTPSCENDNDSALKMSNIGQIDPSLMPFFNIAESKVNKPNFEKSVNYEQEVN